ncbi:twin-arginine translocase TatA/TatE family subunit [Microbacterium indicum]|uniref:twin-arginine translocase TatA/TatE family subunit n=1 Tax=Microbacterium indicum TaxID=358100 RepID=UPI0006863364|nr:twin-arginine translocase TatA/TatE family subunit [Microbacterium indicum]
MGIWQILLILVIVLLIFGASRLPALAKSMGQSARAFKGEMKQMKEEDAASAGTATSEAVDQEKPGDDASASPDTTK